MNDFEIEKWLKLLREYHGATTLELVFSFEDGQQVRHVCKDKAAQ